MKQENIRAEYVEHMGSDVSVLNAARASFGKQQTEIREGDEKLIRFLASGYRSQEWDDFLDQVMACKDRHTLSAMLQAYKRRAQHWAPFAHPHATIRISIPIFLARQFVKHQVGGVWSEESRRYISEEPGVWFPGEWHTRPDDIKQGSGDTLTRYKSDHIETIIYESTQHSIDTYTEALLYKVAPEEARIVLPLNMMTTVVWTGSLLFWSRVYNQRVDSHAQLAAQALARQIGDIMRPLYPLSWKALCDD